MISWIAFKGVRRISDILANLWNRSGETWPFAPQLRALPLHHQDNGDLSPAALVTTIILYQYKPAFNFRI